MKTKLIKVVVLVLVTCTLYINGYGQNIRQLITGDEGRTQEFTSLKIEQQVRFNPENVREILGLDEKSGLVLINTEKDQLGEIHYRYSQTYKGIPIENSMYILHTKNDMLKGMSGSIMLNFERQASQNAVPSVSESKAIELALEKVHAEKYAWQDSSTEQQIKIQTGNSTASNYPTSSLVWYSSSYKVSSQTLHLCYKVDVYALQPFSRAYYFVDAETGEVMGSKSEIFHTDVTGTANTFYTSPFPTIHSDLNGSVYNLQYNHSSPTNSVITLHGETSQFGTAYINPTSSSNWTLSGADRYALDAHYGVSQTYDFYLTKFNRNSVNNNGLALTSYVNQTGLNETNGGAYWNGTAMHFGNFISSGAGITSIDVCGHELTHGVTQNTCALIYEKEPGAINESMSDILGKAVQFWAKPADIDWNLGNDMGYILRNMSNPKQYNQPNTYGGQYYYFTGCYPEQSNDYCGVHTNSGIGNFMFYLLVNGGTGTNDVLNNYSVTGIGLDKSEAIIYRTETVYLNPTSQYCDWRNACVLAATDLYGASSNEVAQVENAWYAVGIGLPGVASIPLTAQIIGQSLPTTTQVCNNTYQYIEVQFPCGSPPYSVTFKDNNNNLLPPITGITVNPAKLFVQVTSSSYAFTINSVSAGSMTGTGTGAASFNVINCCPNIVVNGDFEDHVAGCDITPSYCGLPCAFVNQNRYYVYASSTVPTFPDYFGNAFFVDGQDLSQINMPPALVTYHDGTANPPAPKPSYPATQLHSDIWCQNVLLEPGKNYNIQFLFYRPHPVPNFPNFSLQVKIDGVLMGPVITTPIFDNTWTIANFNWTNTLTSTSGNHEICICQTNYFDGYGFDYLLDNISVRAISQNCSCTVIDSPDNIVQLCTYSWPCNGIVYTASGVYTCTYMGTDSCIHNKELNLTINHVVGTNQTVTSCDAYDWNGITYTLSGTYYKPISPCDFDTLILTIHPSPTINVNPTQPPTCGEFGTMDIVPVGTAPFTVAINPGNVYNSVGSFGIGVNNLSEGIYTITVIDAFGCTATTITTLVPNEAALNFDGVNDYISVSHNPLIDFDTSNFTIEAWVKIDTTPSSVTYPTILSNRTKDPSTQEIEGILIFLYQGRLRVQLADVPNHGPFGPDLRDDICHHIALTRRPDSIRVYIDNIQVGAFTSTRSVSSNGSLYVGWDVVNPYNTKFKGTIDEVRFWDKAKTLSEMISTHNHAVQPQSHLKAYYRFDEGKPNIPNPGVTAYDKSGNGHDGTLHNFGLSTFNSNYVNACVDCEPVLTLVISTCTTYTWPANGTTYTTSGIYQFQTETLDLTILQPATSTSNVTFTNAYTWPLNGLTYTSSGVYTATTMNASGCDSIVTLNLTITSGAFNLNVIEDQQISCHGQSDAALQATASPAGNYVYTIHKPSSVVVSNSTGFFDFLGTGYYTITATDLNSPYGTVQQIMHFTEPEALDLTFITDTLPTCSGNNGALSVHINGGTNIIQPYLTYWYNASNVLLNPLNYFDQSMNGLSAGTYKLVVQDDNYCLDTASVTLNIGTIFKDTSVCNSYTWDGITYTASGIYIHSSTNGVGCITSEELTLTIKSFYDCYCTSVAYFPVDMKIFEVTVNGNSTNPLYANANGCVNVAPGPGSILNKYANFKILGNLTTISQGGVVPFMIKENECDGPLYNQFGLVFWIDYNHNSSFNDPGEKVYATSTPMMGPQNISGSFTVPLAALTGQTGMRVAVSTGIGSDIGTCGETYGETEDYLIDITPPPACAGTPAPGTTIASKNPACLDTAVNLSLQNVPTNNGITFQWYNNAGAIIGATNSTYSFTMTTANTYYCAVTCTNSGLTTNSNPVSVALTPFIDCYCSSKATLADEVEIYQVTINGSSTNALYANTNSCTTLAPGPNSVLHTYSNFKTLGSLTTITQGSTIPFTITENECQGIFDPFGTAIWIDFNHNASFADPGELVFVETVALSGPRNVTGTFIVPTTALNGQTVCRCKVIKNYAGANNVFPCGLYTYGETEDYLINIGPVSTGTTLNLKCFIEGYMNGDSTMQAVLANQGEPTTATACDSIDVELRDANSPYGVVASSRTVLNQNGTATCLFTSTVAPGNYYIAVKHRNGLQTWSSIPLSFDPNSPVVYDFTTSSSQAYGSNQVQVASGVWAFFSGDVVADENIDLLDIGEVETDISNFQFGYYATDINGDGNIDLLDVPALETNINNFIFSNHP